ncbi:ABC transporter permease [Nesterenkonia ebinurensis]|uniref:ABC transporter permease n=1 Tax=Nesterenkonia ebinurensis TaxID=2608252 RepID=UPI00123CD35D|nr:ABC transporter permease [Nesterenkonia ebinurensis]
MSKLSQWTLWPMSILVLLFLWSPMGVILIVSFDTSNYLAFPPQGFTWDNYIGVFENSDFIDAFVVSLSAGMGVALLATTAGTFAALGARSTDNRWVGLLSTFIMSPLLMPNIILGLAMMLVFARLQLLDTITVIVVAHTVITMPYAFRTTTASLQTYDSSSEAAARVLGASPFTVFRRVTLPLIRPGVVSALVLGFLISFDESVISLFITGRENPTLPVVLLNYIEMSADPVIAALSVLLVLMSALIMLLINKIFSLRAVVRA